MNIEEMETYIVPDKSGEIPIFKYKERLRVYCRVLIDEVRRLRGVEAELRIENEVLSTKVKRLNSGVKLLKK
jgi:hypothetical protein